ncbi:MAG: glycoside hydrolase family 20 protein [Muribaculaceae bacterium]|nr:glycoside hydrolase family 20 protein [Muribaculaceae bacterium]
MKKKLFMALGTALIMGLTSSAYAADVQAVYNVIPQPQEVTTLTGAPFSLNSKTVIAYPAKDASMKRNAELLADYLKQLTGLNLKLVTKAPKSNAIVLTCNMASDNKEAYTLNVTSSLITIDGASSAGNFYGIQTLRKSIPGSSIGDAVSFAPVSITDAPRFGYRGAHLDVSRHFFPADSIKTFIDMIALHNANKFHWHLTDDQGWRLESKKYPRLTEVGSVRPGTCIGKNFSTTDGKPYGGFYTQDEVKDIIKYAADRHIDVIPEIDLPGHMLAALKAYPELGCTGGPYELWTRWGVSDDVLCAGNDKTLEFLDGVLDEVCELFPSEYIHVGGDECPKTRWKECAKCQERIKTLGLKDDDHSSAEQKLQTFVMTHASNTLARHGRKMIGWDEILEGGLTPGAIVMSWRGEEGGREAARQNHQAIMTPTSYCYFDYYQSRDANEPLAIGGFLPVEKVYSYEPISSSLTAEEAKNIIGAQANLWTEYIPTFSQAQYMELPRFAALSEVQWTQPNKKDYSNFVRRIPQLIEHYKANGYNYADHVFDVSGKIMPDVEKGVITATFETCDDAPIRFTLDGSEPTASSTLYTAPISIDKSAKIRAAAFRPQQGRSRILTDSVTFNKATTSKVTLANPPHSRYSGQGGLTLVDGRFGPSTFNTGEWLGFVGVPLVATLDLGSEKEFSKISVNNLVATSDWIFDGRNIKVEVSDNGTDFREIAAIEIPQLTEHINAIIPHRMGFDPVKARYVRITEECENQIPEFHSGAGKPAFIFVDEIVIE